MLHAFSTRRNRPYAMHPTTGFYLIHYVQGRYSRKHYNCLVWCCSSSRTEIAWIPLLNARPSASELLWYLPTISWNHGQWSTTVERNRHRVVFFLSRSAKQGSLSIQDRALGALIFRERRHWFIAHNLNVWLWAECICDLFSLGMTNILFRAWREKLSSESSGLDLN